MWIFINALQFIVFISIWLINIPIRTRMVLDQQKRIVNGEFIDDLEIGKKLMEQLGVSTKSKEGPEQSIGTDRFGSFDIFSNIGATLLLVTAIIILITLLVSLFHLICSKCS